MRNGHFLPASNPRRLGFSWPERSLFKFFLNVFRGRDGNHPVTHEINPRENHNGTRKLAERWRFAEPHPRDDQGDDWRDVRVDGGSGRANLSHAIAPDDVGYSYCEKPAVNSSGP